MTKDPKIPHSLINQHNTPLDATSKFAPAWPIRCFECNKSMPGDTGIQVAYKLAGSEVSLHVVVHPGCVSE